MKLCQNCNNIIVNDESWRGYRYCSEPCQKEYRRFQDNMQKKKRMPSRIKSIEKSNRYWRAKQKVLARQATRSRVQFTDEEVKLINSKMPAMEVAEKTGRSYMSIINRRYRDRKKKMGRGEK